MNLNINDVALAVSGKIDRECNIDIKGVSTDSRSIKEGDLFIPIVGENFDGHNFIQNAFDKGASCALTQVIIPRSQKPLIYVESATEALKQLSMYYRGLFNIETVAVTGSVGKTTTKEFIYSILSKKFKTLKNIGNFNNEIGLPLTVFNLNKEHKAAVFEMGMNHLGEIESLSKIVKPDIGVITNIGTAHIENLGSRKNILRAKMEIIKGMNNGKLVLNKDDDMLGYVGVHPDYDIIYYGIKEKCDIYASGIISKGTEGQVFTLTTPNGTELIDFKMAGIHNVYNALAAAAVGHILNIPLSDIKDAIEQPVDSDMRMSVINCKNGATIINDCYNANPESMKAALKVLSEAKNRKIAILGDMLELGEFSEESHHNIGIEAAKNKIDLTICIGQKSKYLFDAVTGKNKSALYYKTKEEFYSAIIDIVKAESTVLIKASRGMKFEEITKKILEVTS